MIETDEQYQITKNWAKRFDEIAATLNALKQTHDLLIEAQIQSTAEMAFELRQEMKNYLERRQSSSVKPLE